MKDIFKIAGIGILMIGGIGAIAFGFNAIGVASLTFWGPKYEEANRKIVQQSIRRQEGVNEGLAALCMNMRLEPNDASKKAFANMLVVQAEATGTQLTPNTENCVAEAKRNLEI